MFNPILDLFPEDYDGYLIRSDFRIGIQITLAIQDDSLTDGEKVATAFNLLYGKGYPRNYEKAYEGLKWFLSGGLEDGERENNQTDGGQEDEEDDSERKNIFDYEYDSVRLHSAFLRTYGIDLNNARLHWFKFRGLISDLGECALSTVIEYRTKDLSDLPPKQRNEYAKLKKKYALPHKLTDEDNEKIAEFLKALDLPQNTGI